MKISSTAKIETPRSLLSRERPPIRDRAVEPFNWLALIDQSVHATKVAIVEALEWISQPLSARELWLILGINEFAVGNVAYHVKSLADTGLIEATDERAARGARETYYLPA